MNPAYGGGLSAGLDPSLLSFRPELSMASQYDPQLAYHQAQSIEQQQAARLQSIFGRLPLGLEGT